MDRGGKGKKILGGKIVQAYQPGRPPGLRRIDPGRIFGNQFVLGVSFFFGHFWHTYSHASNSPA
jgi:hypothetical protein